MTRFIYQHHEVSVFLIVLFFEFLNFLNLEVVADRFRMIYSESIAS